MPARITGNRLTGGQIQVPGLRLGINHFLAVAFICLSTIAGASCNIIITAPTTGVHHQTESRYQILEIVLLHCIVPCL